MLKISDAVRHIVDAHPYLRTALAQRVLNLSQVARHIHASVEARTHKPVQTAAITMSLSRLQAQLPDLDAGPPLRLARRITVQRNLAVVTFPNTSRVQEGLLRVQEQVRRSGGYLTISEGIREITLITEAESLSVLQEMVRDRATRTTTRVASLSVSLTRENLVTPGILYRLLQPLALQGVNVAEVTSTTSEFHIYIAEDDVMLALDSLYGAYGGT
jgi:aspartokinase